MPLFDPAAWHPLFQFLRDELFPLVVAGGGGGVAAAPKHFGFDAYAWEWTAGTQVTPPYTGLDPFTYANQYAVENPNSRKFTVALHIQAGVHYAIVVSALAGPNSGIATLLVDGVLLVDYDLYAASQEAAAITGIFGSDTHEDGLHKIVVECTAKNASSGGYEIPIGACWIFPYDFVA